jgi:hypothetical protein
VLIALGSAQTPSGNTHFWVEVAQSRSARHWLRHFKSTAHTSGKVHWLL